MSRICCIENCIFSNSVIMRTYKITLFQLPSDPSTREKWIFAATGKMRNPRSSQKHFYFCEKHFEASDIVRSFEVILPHKVETIPRERVKLKTTAIPCIFPDNNEAEIIISVDSEIPEEVHDQSLENNEIETISLSNEPEKMYSLEDLKTDLYTKVSVQYAYCNFPMGIMIYPTEQLDTDELNISKCALVNTDMLSEIRLYGENIKSDFTKKITCFQDMLDLMNSLRQMQLCKNKKRNEFCLGVTQNRSRSRFCMPCRINERKKQDRMKKKIMRSNAKKKRIQDNIRNMKLKIKRLQNNLINAKKNIEKFSCMKKYENLLHSTFPRVIVCSVLGCTNRSTGKSVKQNIVETRNKITFHTFPNNIRKRNAWLKAIGRMGWNPTQSSVICSDHFTEDSFYHSSLRTRLRKAAIPRITNPADTNSLPVQASGIKELTIAGTVISPISTLQQDQIISDIDLSTNLDNTDLSQTLQVINVEPVAITETSSDSSVFTQDKDQFVSNSNSLKSITREICASEATLLNKIREMDEKHKFQIKLLKPIQEKSIKKVATMSSVLYFLKSQRFLRQNELNILKNISNNEDILKPQTGSEIQEYSEELRKFAINLHFYSPDAYNYVRSTFQSCLPDLKILLTWYDSVCGTPGFTSEGFQALKCKSQNADNILCSLCVDEMAIKRQIEFDGKKYYGHVEYGIENDNSITEAKDILIFLIVCINGSWKIPVAYFPIDGISAEQRCNLINICLSKCHEVGIRVVSLTFGDDASNLSIMSLLGCDLAQRKTWFHHPDTKDKIYFYPNPSHMLKNVRNAFHNYGILYDEHNEKISWAYITYLQQLQKSADILLRNVHIDYKTQIMKIQLTSQLFSESLACTLELCGNELQLSYFKDVWATVRFIYYFSNLFYILNSKNTRQPSFKAPLSRCNITLVLETLNMCESYIEKLKTENCLIINSNTKTGFVGFLICINSIKSLYTDLIENNSLTYYIPTYKMSLDHSKVLFSLIFTQSRFSANPTVRQFSIWYKKLLTHLKLQTASNGNCVSLENINILHIPCSTKNKTNAVLVINNSLNISYTEQINEDDQQKLVSVMQNYRFLQETTEYTENVFFYIIGFVIIHLKTVLHCEECIAALEGNEKDRVFSNHKLLINSDLLYPSLDVQKVCKMSEKVFRQAFRESDGNYMNKKCTILILVSSVLNYCKYRNIFENLSDHANDQNPMENHMIHIIKAISEKYILIRLYFIENNMKNELRNKRLFEKC